MGIDGKGHDVIGRISTDVHQARRLSQVVCGLVIAAATLFSLPMDSVHSGTAVAGVAGVGVGAVVIAGVAGVGRRLRR